ncbi:TYW4 protein, partial [Uria aalge]|nr:TYW4 protein [Uria aalge]
VQGTGGSSAVSKCSAAARGYIQDRFLQLLVGRRRRRAPLIHRGYYIRARAVDHCVQDFLLKTRSHPRTQIVSLGAGFDSLYFRLKDVGLLRHTVVYEVDFPNVACQKATLIKRTKELSALVGDTGGEGLGMIFRESILNTKRLEEANITSAFKKRCMMVEELQSYALIQWAAEHFSRACFLLYEQMHPEDPFGRVMQQHFSQMNSALNSLARYPDCEAQQMRFFEKGWTECSVMDMNEFFTCCTPEDEQQRMQALEPFDEYEEWHLKCSHYFVLTASKGMEPSWTPLLSNMTGIVSFRLPRGCCVLLAALSKYCSAEHSGVCHEVCALFCYPRAWNSTCSIPVSEVLLNLYAAFFRWEKSGTAGEKPRPRLCERLYHTVSCLSNSLALVVGGRTSPSGAGLGMLWLKFPETCNASEPDDIAVELVSLQPAAEPAALRWRHSTTEVIFKGEKYLFLYGGRSATEPVLGDWCFLHTQELSCIVIPVEGPVPESRHSHSACSWKGGVLIAGGLGAAEQPLGSVFFLRELEHGFQWQTVETHPPLSPRYSHTAHVHDGKLLLVGGVWFHSSSVPGVTVIDLITGLCLDYTINV